MALAPARRLLTTTLRGTAIVVVVVGIAIDFFLDAKAVDVGVGRRALVDTRVAAEREDAPTTAGARRDDASSSVAMSHDVPATECVEDCDEAEARAKHHPISIHG